MIKYRVVIKETFLEHDRVLCTEINMYPTLEQAQIKAESLGFEKVTESYFFKTDHLRSSIAELNITILYRKQFNLKREEV